jgi:hypothetical protein
LATTLSTRFSLISNLLICSVLFLVGLMSDYLVGRHAREPWQDSVPKGKSELWICSYTFAPTEMGVRKWNHPERIDVGEAFIVWSDREKPSELPDMGADPKGTWKDGNGWKDDVADLDDSPYFMAKYNTDSRKWETTRIKEERKTVSADAKGMDAKFTSYVFRRSMNPPGTPRGGNYSNPLPSGGSYTASALYAVIPNWQLFWMADALNAGKKIPMAYLFFGGAYAVVLVAFMMVFAIMLFGNREVGNQVIE